MAEQATNLVCGTDSYNPLSKTYVMVEPGTRASHRLEKYLIITIYFQLLR